ncbi:MAG: XRE family transcriptional regulator [Comamonadaceae bacterium]|nr:MAG: XRE family transcriptional regulator [Comamonadaceae bacterium]
MPKPSTELSSLPEAAEASLLRLGQRLRAHRVQRGWTVAEMAERLLCSPTTWRALERGKPGTSIGLLAHALWLFGETESLDIVAPAPAALAANRRVRRAAGRTPAGVIAEDERDF